MALVFCSSGEMEKMLASFGADFSKSIQNKRKKLDTFTQASLQSSNKKMKEMTHKQQQERLAANSSMS